MQTCNVKRLVRFTLGILLCGPAVFSAQAAFTNLYVFGDGASTTTNNTILFPSPTNYYGQRFCNGRVWVEVLAQRQGLTLYSTNNWSYYNNFSATTNTGPLVTNVSNFQAPTNATNALFVIWVNSADLIDDLGLFVTNIAPWTNAINLAQTNHFKAITNLYAKGARTLIMPGAVDITAVPEFANTNLAFRNFIRQRCIDYNTAFSNTLNRAKATCTNLTIYEPDFFTLLNNLLTNAAAYGLTNALDDRGVSIDALADKNLTNKSTNGPGANYIFWDDEDPTAKVHALMANAAQQLISPVRISKITWLGGSNRLDVTNMPIGQNGLVVGRTNLVLGNWTTNANFNSTNATQSIFVTNSGPWWFYRLSFPFTWAWP